MQPASAYAAALVGAALLSAGLIRLLHPLLVRYALARPNARSSHRVPTPQGGGITVVAAALALGLGCAAALAGAAALPPLVGLAAAAIILAALGAADDIRPLPALPRLLVQMAAVAAIVWLADPARILPEAVPLPVERALLVLAGTWWVNLVNFMDGIDWITVAEFVPLCGAIAIAALAGLVPIAVGAMAAALCGALLGFAPANRPVARLFLGDVGSLPIGLLTGWLLLSLAGSGHLAAALLLPLYHVMDATLTLLRRALSRERVWEAHRSHFYQRATDAGFRVIEIDAHIVVLNLVLAGLAAATMLWPAVSWPALGIGLALTALLLRRFITPRSV